MKRMYEVFLLYTWEDELREYEIEGVYAERDDANTACLRYKNEMADGTTNIPFVISRLVRYSA